jgi:lipopolysaccharide export system protein LptA
MRFKISLFIPALFGTVLVIACPAQAAQVISRGGQDPSTEINVTADKLTAEEGSNRLEALGNVEIKRGGMTLKADEARMNRATQDTEAKGRVTVDDPEWKVKSADSIQMNLEKETGEILNGDLFLEDGHISMTGRRFQKFGGQTYHVDDGFFTTCLCESGAPSWKFYAEQMDLTLDGAGTIRNGYFYIMDVPVFYLPYGYFPLSTERQTGFLFPQFGQSSKEGFRFIQPFFWAISKSTDATVKFDVETRARLGGLGEFRTLFEKNSDFRIDAAYFNENLRKNAQDAVVDQTIADPTIPKNRWSVGGSHRYTTASDWLTYSDFGAYSDDLFTRELMDRFDLPGSQESDLRRSRFGESRFGLFKNWGDTFLKGQWNFYQDFIQPDSTTFQRTPQIAFWGRRLLSGFPLEFRWRADGVNYLRHASGDGLRLDLRPEVVLPFRLASRFFGSVAVAPRETVYHLYSPVASSSDRNLSRELVEIRNNIGTSLSRTFGFNSLGLSQVKHVIEPELSYLFVPRADQSHIPIMDEIDRVNRRNVLTFAVANRLWGKSQSGLAVPDAESDVEQLNSGMSGDVRQMASVRLALSYDIDKERKGGDSLSDLDLNVRLSPVPYIDFGFDGGVNPGPWNVTQARARVAVSDPRPILRRTLDPDFNTGNSISMSYHYLRRGPNSFLADDANIDLDAPFDIMKTCAAHPLDPRCPGTGFDKNTVGNIGANMLYHATDNLLFTVNSTYDARDSRFLGFRVITKFLSFCECWTVTLGLKRDINPAKTSFSFDFSLLGLGNTQSSLKK